MSYLNENNLTSYATLNKRESEISLHLDDIQYEAKHLESKIVKISMTQKQIINISKTRATYDAYRKSGYSKEFKKQHLEEIELHQEAKKFFDEYDGQVPKMADLKIEYATLNTQKKKLWDEFNFIKAENREILIAKKNIDLLLQNDAEAEKVDEVKNSKKQDHSI